MRKKNFMRGVALVACLSILSLSAPGVSAVEKGTKKSDSKFLFRKPAMVLLDFYLFLNPVLVSKKFPASRDFNIKNNPVKKSTKIIKTTGGLMLPIVSEDD